MPDPHQSSQTLPLCIDLDGTLLLTDSLWESVIRLIAHNPLLIFLLPLWLLSGKAALKKRISQYVSLNIGSLPLNQPLLEYIRQQRLTGRRIVLITAADEKVAQAVVDHLDLFDTVLASDGAQNLSGARKARALVELYGEKGYVYAANDAVDIPVWQQAAAAIVVNAPAALHARIRSLVPIETELPEVNRPRLLHSLLRAIRPHQWVKNLLLFIPLILAHQWSGDRIVVNFIAFVAFCLAASSIYIINDLFDLDSDRQHDTKQTRPFASGALSIPTGASMALVLFMLSLALAVNINTYFVLAVLAYIFLTTCYTLILKHIVLIDVLTLTSLYTIRIIAGAVAVAVDVSYWLIAFSIFIFLSLGLIKRYIELQKLFLKQGAERSARDYTVDDLPVVLLFGVCSGFLSVLVMVLYLNDLQASKLYSEPAWLWIVGMGILYWINRVWLLAHRGELHEDPVLFALHDRISYIVVLIIVLSMYLAL